MSKPITMTDFENAIKTFIRENIDPTKPLLVAVSGGPDSLALLIALSTISGLTLAVAHVDHGWRETSASEADCLKSVADRLGVRFHLKTLNPKFFTGNRENFCREARYDFFCQLIIDHNYQGVMLGHHSDDQSETVLKRIFEGVHFTKLKGITAVSERDGITLFRPLLGFSKHQILEFLKSHPYQAVDDITNREDKYLRAKMRINILPFLNEQFGKNIWPSLKAISEQAVELCDYLDFQINPYLKQIVIGPFGMHLDLSQNRPNHLYEMKYLIKKIGEINGLCFSKQIISTLSELMTTKIANKKICFNQYAVHVDRGHLFLFNKRELKIDCGIQTLRVGSQRYGHWTVEIKEINGTNSIKESSWKDLWKGELVCYLPEGEFQIGYYQPNILFDDQCLLSEWLGKQKVPLCVRNLAPIIYEKGKLCYEFLSKKGLKNISKGFFVKLVLE